MVPDQFFDEHLAFLSGAEIKVLLYIVRRTFGFKKDADNISLSQMLQGIVTRDGRRLDYGVGLSKKTLLQALRDLQEKRLIVAKQRQSQERGNEPTRYHLNLYGTSPGVEITPPLGEKLHQGGGGEIPPSPRGRNSPTQETVSQETDIQKTDLSNIREAMTSHKDLPPIQEAIDLKRAGVPLPCPVERPRRDFSRVADIMVGPASQRPSMKRLRAQKAYSSERQRLLAMMEDFAVEFGDQAPLPITVQRTFNLWEKSGVPIEAFTALMYEARALTKEYSGNITKQRKAVPGERSAWGPGKNKMPYFFATLTSILESVGPKTKPPANDAKDTAPDTSG
jgi:hypothetical protein